MDDKQSYKSPKKIFDLIKEGISKRIEKQIMKKQLEYPIKELKDLLYNMAKNAQEKANLPEIEGLDAVIDLYSNKRVNTQLEYRIATSIYNKGNVIGCYSTSEDLPYKVMCIYNDRIFALFDSPQSISFIENIKKIILHTFNILNPGVLTYMYKQPILIETYVCIDPNKPIKENPEISIDNNKYIKFIYYDGKFNIKMTW
jgi:hypothetical protein